MSGENTDELLQELEELNVLDDSDFSRLSSAFKDLSVEEEEPLYTDMDQFPPRIRRWALVNSKTLKEAEKQWYEFAQVIQQCLAENALASDIVEQCDQLGISDEKREFMCSKNVLYALYGGYIKVKHLQPDTVTIQQLRYITSEWGLNILHRDVMTIEQMLNIKDTAKLSALVLDEVGFNLMYYKLVPAAKIREISAVNLHLLSTNTGMAALHTKNLKIDDAVRMSEEELSQKIASVLARHDAARRRLTFSLAEQLDDELNMSADSDVSFAK